MKTIFNSDIHITQEFGIDFEYPEGSGNMYYQSLYGLEGHNGIDLVPQNHTDDRVYSILTGLVVFAGYNSSYGNRIVIWNVEQKLIETFSHLKTMYVQVGRELTGRVNIGVMGNTGVSIGAHVHYQRAEVDALCQRLHSDNGYTGWIDPKPFLII